MAVKCYVFRRICRCLLVLTKGALSNYSNPQKMYALICYLLNSIQKTTASNVSCHTKTSGRHSDVRSSVYSACLIIRIPQTGFQFHLLFSFLPKPFMSWRRSSFDSCYSSSSGFSRASSTVHSLECPCQGSMRIVFMAHSWHMANPSYLHDFNYNIIQRKLLSKPLKCDISATNFRFGAY